MKLDCEGAEYEILWDKSLKLLARSRIIMEYHDLDGETQL